MALNRPAGSAAGSTGRLPSDGTADSTPGHTGASLAERLVLAAAFMALLVAGGGSWVNPLSRMAAQGIALVVVVVAAARMDWRLLWRQDRWAALIVLGLAVLIAGQLWPLPGWFWQDLPGRALYADGDVLMFGVAQSRPLSLDPEATIGSAIALLPALATWLVLRQRPGLASGAVALFLGFLALSLVVALAQVAGGDGRFHFYTNSHSQFATGFFANRNHEAAAMACGIPLAAGLQRYWAMNGTGALSIGRPGQRWLFPVAAVALTLGALITSSRSGAALLVLAIPAGVAIAFGGRAAAQADGAGLGTRRPAFLKPMLIPLFIVAALILAIVALALIAPGGPLGAVFSRSFLGSDGRYRFWPAVITLIMTHAPWGSGIGTFFDAFQSVEPPTLLSPLYLNHAHNDWLELVSEAGVPGLVLALGFVGWCAVRGLAGWRRDDAALAGPLRPLVQAAGIVIALLLVHSLFDYPLRTPALSACLAGAAAILSAGRSGARGPIGAQLPPEESGALRPRLSWLAAIIAVALAIPVGRQMIHVNAAAGMTLSGRAADALDMPGASGRAWGLYAEQRAQAGEVKGKVSLYAVRGVALIPLNEPAFTAAALVMTNPDQVRDLLFHARQLTARDPVLLGAMFDDSRRRHDPAGEAAAVHDMLRLGYPASGVIARFVDDLADPAVRRAAIPVLGDPVFRTKLFEQMAVNDARKAQSLRLLASEAAAAGVRLTAHERGLLIGGMLAAVGRAPGGSQGIDTLRDAWQFWLAGSGGRDPQAWPAGDWAAPGIAFEWQPGAASRLAGEGGDRHLEFDSLSDAAAPLASRALVLAPGTYRARIVANPVGAAIVLTCGDGTSRLRDGDPVVVSAGCGLARLAVMAPADAGRGRVDIARLVPQ
jgi:O-antigen ligase